MAGGKHITLFGAAFTISILSMAVAVSDNMCTTSNRFGQTNYTYHYSPTTHELKKCCCNLSSSDADVSVSISSNATFFELVFLTNGTVKSLRNKTGLSLSNSIQFCGKKSESGFVIITGNKEFQVRCIESTTVASTTEESVTSSTTQVALSTATIPDDPKKHNIKTTTAHPLPFTTSHVQNGSASVSQNEKPMDDTGFSSVVIGIIIGSVAVVLVIIIGVVISFLIYRKRSRATDRDEGNQREGHDTLMTDNILYSHENSAYSLARGTELVDADDPGREDVNNLVMSENCLYNHQQESSIDRIVHEGQGHYQTAGLQNQSGEASTHKEKPDFSHLYAKVDKTLGNHN